MLWFAFFIVPWGNGNICMEGKAAVPERRYPIQSLLPNGQD